MPADTPKFMGAKQMIKLASTTAVALVALTASAFAAGYSVTEISAVGIKRANGTWTLSTEGDKVSGKAELQLDNGTPVTYKIDGKVEGGAYTLNLSDRTDGKKDCVWTGKPNESGKVFEGPVVCGSEKFSIRAGVQ
ncbi:hypothetical protein F7D14_07615 [Methylocystis parvus]|uniref:Uncharacterized protein n=2 Tax=Methylocystis parvus TaxID=134 RepID=A0A6B8MG07_9HYPH|nr:hypothetical protein F7D14_07615 [Methylocystis parvus]